MRSSGRDSSAVLDWAASGAFALTGRPDGPPILPPGVAATVARTHLAALDLEIPGLLGERAAYADLHRRGPWSCGGAFRTLGTRDGDIGLSLARPSDVDLVPALVEGVVDEPWQAVADWARTTTTREAADRIRLLGLPGGAVPEPERSGRDPVTVRVLGPRGPRRAQPLVVDLTSLWAGPLCAHLLRLRGAEIVKVESRQRPDGARLGAPRFFELLHRGHRQVTLDLATEMDQLRALVREADLVLAAARPRAFAQLGLEPEEIVATGTSWLSITARGLDSDSVGFGDDVAACAGLVVADDTDLLPVGDAIADPLTGVTAAVAATEALSAEESRLVDVSMLHVSAATLADPRREPHAVVRRGDRWWVECEAGAAPVRDPRRRGEP